MATVAMGCEEWSHRGRLTATSSRLRAEIQMAGSLIDLPKRLWPALCAIAQTGERSGTELDACVADGMALTATLTVHDKQRNGAFRKWQDAMKEPLMIRVNTAAITLCLIGVLPVMASAQSPVSGPEQGDREFSLSGTGSSAQNFDSASFGVTGDLGWYLQRNLVLGVRQSVNYASIEGASIKNDFWNGSTRGYLNYQFLSDRARPFVGASLGGIYGDGVKNSAFAGLETGVKYYVRTKTYLLARIEYQFLFSSTGEAADAFQDDGVWAYTVGLGFNF